MESTADRELVTCRTLAGEEIFTKDSPALLWLGEDAVLRFGDVSVAAPMTYCSAGPSGSQEASKEASCICAGMAVSIQDNVKENPDDLAIGYWPSYSAMKPHQRGYYLRWLASGKKTMPADIGYAFVYFYGLERRALLDRRDIFRILEEAKRLLEVCGASKSFRGYLTRFLVYLHAKYLNDPAMTGKNLADLYRLFPPSQGSTLSRLVLGYHALRNTPLSAEQAFNLLQRLPKTEKSKSFSPRFSSSPELKRLFALRYGRVYPRGFTLSASFGKKDPAAYSPASGTLASAEGMKPLEPATIPNVLGKASQFKKFQEIYDACIEELAAAKGRSVSDELVVVRSAGKRPPGEPLPLVRIDLEKVAALREETESLTRQLAAVFVPEEENEAAGSGSVPAESNPKDAEEGTEPLPFSEDAVKKLDRGYWPCVSSLLRRAEWSKEDLAALARRCGLMPNAMLNAVNTWSVEALGDFLLIESTESMEGAEEREAWTVNEELIEDSSFGCF
ncbi:MAG: TerB N-terminal domain-containing protein [Synergistaceae bacterium]|jgi:hypothetical protein|nr:TerB N-terminal domain-containing protein [Synergistaceae bacterium]